MHGYEKQLVEQFNDEFINTVLPVTIFVGIEVVVGFFGNILVMYVFLFRYHVCNFRYFVLCLAFTDILSTVTTMPGEVLTQLKWYVYPVREICKIKSFFNIFTVASGAFCLLIIAVDRYRKVCRPFGWQIKPHVAIILCGVIYIISAILAAPVSFLWGTRNLQKLYKNTTINVTICEKDVMYAHTPHPFEYSTAVEVIISILLVAMCILYILVARTLVKQRRGITGAITTISAPSSSGAGSSGFTSGASSAVGKSYSNAEMSKAGNSEDLESKNKYQNVSSDGGLTTDEEEGVTSGASSAVGKSHSNAKTSKTGNSVNFESQNQNVSSDGGLTTDEEKGPSRNKTFDLSRGTQGGRKKQPTLTVKRSRRTKRAIVSLRRKTWIMFILTVTFVITTVLYLALLSMIAKSDDVLQEMSDVERAFYFFFFRLYFINHVMNPIVYGVLDPHFQKVMKNIKQSIFKCSCLAVHQ